MGAQALRSGGTKHLGVLGSAVGGATNDRIGIGYKEHGARLSGWERLTPGVWYDQPGEGHPE